jgi:hypothetical protein
MNSSTQPVPKEAVPAAFGKVPGHRSLTDAVTDDTARFRASLDAKDRIIHDLAVKLLKRYTPHRTNAWAAWKKG